MQDKSLEIPKRTGYAASILPEEREALIETLTEDIAHQAAGSNDFTTELMLNALEDAKGL